MVLHILFEILQKNLRISSSLKSRIFRILKSMRPSKMLQYLRLWGMNLLKVDARKHTNCSGDYRTNKHTPLTFKPARRHVYADGNKDKLKSHTKALNNPDTQRKKEVVN